MSISVCDFVLGMSGSALLRDEGWGYFVFVGYVRLHRPQHTADWGSIVLGYRMERMVGSSKRLTA